MPSSDSPSPPLREPSPPVAPPPRCAPERAFPPYRYVPRLNPHPLRHEGGHARGPRRPGSAGREGSDDRAAFRFACDLYNHAYYWEAHEEWESIWHRLPRDGAERLLVQGLIQVSAAHLKRHLGASEAAGRLAALATDKLRRAANRAGSTRVWGVLVVELAAAVEAHAAAPGTAPWPVLRVGAPDDEAARPD